MDGERLDVALVVAVADIVGVFALALSERRLRLGVGSERDCDAKECVTLGVTVLERVTTPFPQRTITGMLSESAVGEES